MKKEAICEAFCGELAVRRVPSGLAIKTPFSSSDGDAIDFFVVQHEQNPDLYRLEDSGLIVPNLESLGVTVQQEGERGQAFRELLDEHDAELDQDSLEIHSRYMPEAEVGAASLRFVSLLLRLQDLELLKPEKVESAFKEDAIKAIKERFKDKGVELKRDAFVSDKLSNYIVDMLVAPLGRDPVAIYFATSELKVDEAVILKLESRILHRDLKVVVLLEHVKPKNVNERAIARGQNYLDGMPVFRGSERPSMEKIAELAGFERND